MRVVYFLLRSSQLLCCLIFLFRASFAVDTLRPLESINDGGTLVSSNGSFELGFFSPGSSKNRYLGIWYKNIPVQTVVWVANRCNPIIDMSGVLRLNSSGSLVLLGQNNTVVWSPKMTTSLIKQAQKPILQLQDSGNLVIRDEDERNPETYMWQSFDYPSDTFLPRMKLGFNFRTNHTWNISAWKNADDPCPTELTYGMELHPYPEPSIRMGEREYFRHGPWNGLHCSGTVHLRPNQNTVYEFVHDNDEVSWWYYVKNESVLTRVTLNPTTSKRERLEWNEEEKIWSVLSAPPTDSCDSYGLCGANGNCVISSTPVCQCLKGFKPKSPENWNAAFWADGCGRNIPLSCQDKENDGFIKFSHSKVPDTKHTWVNWSMNTEECRAKCLRDCSCMAYSNTNITGEGSGCAMWFDDLIDIRQISDGGQDLYIRMPASELRDGRVKVLVVASVVGVISVILLAGYFVWRRSSRAGYFVGRRSSREKSRRISQENGGREREEFELPLFDLSIISTATDNFSEINKLGEGGFGPVYRVSRES